MHTAARAFGDQLRSIPDGSVQVPNLAWSVSELGRHLLSLPHLYKTQNELGASFEPPDSWPDFSASVRADLTEDDPKALAEAIETEMASLFDELGSDPNTARMLYGRSVTSYGTAASVLGELLMHGMDLSRLTGAKVAMNRRQAIAIVDQQVRLTPVFVDQDKARRLDGTYGLRFRGGREYHYVIEDGIVTVHDGRPDLADARMVADPVAFVLSSLGRIGPVRVVLTGRIVAYGRKPWRMARLGNVAVDGV